MPHSQPTASVCKFHLDPQYHIFHWGFTILGDSTLCLAWDPIWITGMGNHGAAGGILRMQAFLLFYFILYLFASKKLYSGLVTLEKSLRNPDCDAAVMGLDQQLPVWPVCKRSLWCRDKHVVPCDWCIAYFYIRAPPVGSECSCNRPGQAFQRDHYCNFQNVTLPF